MPKFTAKMRAADMERPSLRLVATAPVEIQAGKDETALPTYSMVGYTGVPMNVEGFYHPVIVDLDGAQPENPVNAYLNHDSSQIIGQGEARIHDGQIVANGTVMAADANSQNFLSLSKNGFKWQASIGANINRREFLDAGKKAVVNGREVTGPLIIARESAIYEISFVPRGADSSTSAAIAASHPEGKGTTVDPKFTAWLEENDIDASGLSPKAISKLEATWKAETGNTKKSAKRLGDVIAEAEAEDLRQERIADLTASFIAEHPYRDADFIANIRQLSESAVEAKWTPEEYELRLLRAGRPQSSVFRPSFRSESKLTNKVLQAAIFAHGMLPNYEKLFDDQTLQAAHDLYKGRIGLKQLIMVCAEANGHRGNHSTGVTLEAHRAAFGFSGPNQINAGGFSGINISNILSTTANKFLLEGWLAVDQTPLRIAAIRPVPDLKTVTTVSLLGDLTYDKVGPAGEIKHGTLSDQTYTNKAETYARMLAITEDDIINDDLGALTMVPRRLGRGAGLKLNDIFWTAFLGAENAGFFAAGNSNLNTAVADATVGGLQATETIFMNQTDPDGLPLGIMPKIIVVPTATKASFAALMNSERLITGASSTLGDANVWKDRFRLESSPYMSNSSYTGYSAAAWYMLADPNELPMIEIAAYQGRVEPTVESANADFNTLGVQMRGYSRVGVSLFEKRAAVKADGGAS